MPRAILIVNPNSGRRPELRAQLIQKIADALHRSGCDTKVVATEGPGTAGKQASDACADGADIVFACGGDGTIHEVIQGMAFQPQAVLGIIPMGSANVLARHLRISMDPIRAALQQLHYSPRTIPIGQVTCDHPQGQRSRYFIVMAGAGPDGALVYKMLSGGKHRLGRISYYLRAARLFSTAHFSSFAVTTNIDSHQAVSAMAVRVADLGGLFSPLIRGGSIEHAHLRLSLVSPPARSSLLAWFASGWTRLHRINGSASIAEVENFSCSVGDTSKVMVQADGEWIGQTPMSVRLIPNALRLLMPDG